MSLSAVVAGATLFGVGAVAGLVGYREYTDVVEPVVGPAIDVVKDQYYLAKERVRKQKAAVAKGRIAKHHAARWAPCSNLSDKPQSARG